MNDELKNKSVEILTQLDAFTSELGALLAKYDACITAEEGYYETGIEMGVRIGEHERFISYTGGLDKTDFGHK